MKQIISLTIMMSLSSCFDLTPGQKVTINTYGGHYDIIYIDENGQLIEDKMLGAWEYVYKANAGDSVYVMAVRTDSTEVSVITYLDGKPWITTATDKDDNDTLIINVKVPLFN